MFNSLFLADQCFLSCLAVDCGTLPNPANGRVILGTTTVGSIAVYECNRGFGLLGTSTRTCQANGQWSDQAPTCERKHWTHGTNVP